MKKSWQSKFERRRDDKAIERNTYWQRGEEFSRLNEGNKKIKHQQIIRWYRQTKTKGRMVTAVWIMRTRNIISACWSVTFVISFTKVVRNGKSPRCPASGEERSGQRPPGLLRESAVPQALPARRRDGTGDDRISVRV